MAKRRFLRTSICLFAGCLYGAVYTLADSADELRQAAKSPYEIAKFFNSRRTFDVTTLWESLGKAAAGYPEGPFLAECEDFGCSAEILVAPTPPQTILVLRDRYGQRVYLRYMATSEGWALNGIYQPFAKYFELRHELKTIGSRTYLLLTSQGLAGLGLSSEIALWFDLTRPEFEPVFTFTQKGQLAAEGSPGIESKGQVVLATGERIDVKYTATFLMPPNASDGPLAHRADIAHYLRKGSKFEFERSDAGAKEADINNLYALGLARRKLEAFLPYLMPELRGIARGPAREEKKWLEDYLSYCPDTKEKRELVALLANRSKK
jgi:hypothetical protein